MGWRLVPADGLLIKDWGEEHSIVFATETNATHLVTSEAARWLGRAMQEGGFPAEAFDEEQASLLVNAGLVRRVASA